MADKSSGSEDEKEYPMNQISYKRKYCREDSDRESEKETSDVSMDSVNEKSLTLAQADDDKSSLWGEKKNRTPRKLMKLKDIIVIIVDEGSFLTQQSQVSQEEEELTDECQSELAAYSPEAEEKPERLFSQLLTANDTSWRLDVSQDQIQHFPSSEYLTAEFFKHGRQMTLRVVDESGKGWKMMLTSYLDVDGRRSYCISYGWMEFVKAHNLEVGDEIIFYRIPSNKDNKELIIEFIKARNL